MSNKELDALFADESKDCPKWIGRGYIPKHYKRLSCSRKEADRLAEIGFIEIAKYYGDNLYYTQSVIAGAIFSGDYDRVTVVTPSSYGKLIADDEPVLTRNGWKNHGDLIVGDEVVAPNGDFVKVIYVHPKGLANRVVKFADGSEVKCHENHLWAVNYRNAKTNARSVKVRSVAEMEKANVTYQSGKEKGRSKYTLIKREAIKGEHKDLAVPPYVMGAWLGDGSTTKGQICAHPNDRAVLDKCKEFYPNGSEWSHKDSGVITRSFIGLANDLTAYNMCFQRKDTPRKHIPEEYLTASLEQRLELLAGLMDTDGYVQHNQGGGTHARCVFTTADVELKDSMEELISTFGWRVSITVVPPCVSSSGIVGKRDTYVVSFSPDMVIPCVLERKRIAESELAKQRNIGITAIEPIEPVQGNCITVEGGLYCVGKRMLPTHNSWLLGRCANVLAFRGEPMYIVAATQDETKMIMGHVGSSLQSVAPEVQNALTTKKDKIEKLITSVSKQRIAFSNGGFVEPITTGDTYDENIAQNKVVGKPGNYFVDEAALVSEKSFAELGRADMARVDGRNYLRVMISNPHQRGYFYTELTKDKVGRREIIIWMDALTAVEEGRITKEKVYEGDFAKHKSTLRRYLLCILDEDGDGMFVAPDTYKGEPYGKEVQWFMGVDAAYKGKDNIEVALTAVGNGKVWSQEVVRIEKKNWIDGITPKDIIRTITRLAKAYHVALICVDVGWGVWLTMGLQDAGLPVMGVNFSASPTQRRVKAKHYAATNASNLRAEMHLDFQDLAENSILEMNEDVFNQIKTALPYISSKRTASGKLQIRPKSEIKAIIGKSPDELDAILLSIHALIMFLGDSAFAIT